MANAPDQTENDEQMFSLLNGIISEERRYAALPYSETGNNHQRFSDVVNGYGLAGCQNQAWCATYQFALELEAVGKDQALKNWNMTAEYVGFNCFATEEKFKRAGKTGKTPRLGALVIFSRSHMGRVLSINKEERTFECGEGNTSNKQYDRNGDSCAVKRYAWDDPGIRSFCYIDYTEEQNLTAKEFVKATKAVYEAAHNGHYRYGDSHALPPCSDGIISCDRLAARALWNLGYQQQPAGGITVINMERYLTGWGFRKITDPAKLQAGDIVLMKQNGTSAPTAAWHTFVLTRFGSVNSVDKFDTGSQQRIEAVQPFKNVPLNQWPGQKSFYAAFRAPGEKKEKITLTFDPVDLKRNTKNAYAYSATEILKARGYKGRKGPDGKLKELVLDHEWTCSDAAAAAAYKLDRIRANAWQMGEQSPAGQIRKKDWQDLLGMAVPFDLVELPAKQKEGLQVLFLQEKLRARGITGADGKPLALDRKYGPNTEAAVQKDQKAMKLKVTGRVTRDDWISLTGIKD